MQNNVFIGVDVGGTNTDAVILEGNSNNVLSWFKSATTGDVTRGIVNAIEGAMKQLSSNNSNNKKYHVSVITIGTTHV
jgi:N-methylhydantoinase A/oxoprolinase/acetone carboxylase beta subunit